MWLLYEQTFSQAKHKRAQSARISSSSGRRSDTLKNNVNNETSEIKDVINLIIRKSTLTYYTNNSEK